MNQQEIPKVLTPQMLVVSIICCVIIWITKFYWGKKHSYRLASRIPGPPGYPILGNAISFCLQSNYEFLNKVVSLGRKYTPLCKVWMAHELVIFISEPDHVEYIMNSPNCLGKNFFYDLTRPYMGLGLFSAPVNIWKKNRKIINPTFNQKILNGFLPVFNKESKVFTDKLANYVGAKDVDIMNLTSILTLNTLCGTVMGVDVKNQTFINRYGQCLDKAMEAAMIRMNNVLYYSDFVFYMTKIGKEFNQAVLELNQFTKKVVQNKKEASEKMIQGVQNDKTDDKGSILSRSFLDQLLRLCSEGIKLTDQELQDEVNTFMAAGSDTTANTLSFCFLTLGIHAAEQEKIYREVIDVLGEDRDVTLEDLRQLQYTERFIKETLRIFPIANMYVRTSPVDIKLGDYDIPANSSLVLVPLLTHRNPKYWKDPMKFDTDRFFPEEIAKRHPYLFIPFSGGPRGCIGLKYAYMVLKTAIAHTVRKYRIKCDYKSVEEVELTVNLMLRPEYGFKVSLEHRK